jgi:molybdate transport system substrate-binding protein
MRYGLTFLLGAAIGAISIAQSASSAEIKVLTTGAFKQVVVALVPEFEKATGNKVVIDNGTVGQLQKRVDGGESFDVLVLSPKGIEDYIKTGKIAADSKANLAKVGVGVMVKEGAPKPDIATVEAFKQALLKAKSVGYIDPASGGSSGIYVAGLLDKLGIAAEVKPKAKLQRAATCPIW